MNARKTRNITKHVFNADRQKSLRRKSLHPFVRLLYLLCCWSSCPALSSPAGHLAQVSCDCCMPFTETHVNSYPAGAIPAATARESHLLLGDLFGASKFLTESAPEIGCLCPLLLRWQSDAPCVTAVSECTLAAFRLSSDDNTGAPPPFFKVQRRAV